MYGLNVTATLPNLLDYPATLTPAGPFSTYVCFSQSCLPHCVKCAILPSPMVNEFVTRNLMYCFAFFDAGRPMIECSSCLIWLHMSCAKVRPSNVPDVWTCQACKETNPRKRARLSRDSSLPSPS